MIMGIICGNNSTSSFVDNDESQPHKGSIENSGFFGGCFSSPKVLDSYMVPQ